MHKPIWREILAGVLALPIAVSAAESDTASQWPTYAHDVGGSQYTALSQIDRSNVDELEVAWVHHSGDVIDEPSPTGTSLQVTPIHANNHVYYCTPLNRVFALDPGTGEERWIFDPHAEHDGRTLVEEERKPGTCRGVAYWESSAPVDDAVCNKRVFKSDRNGHIYAINADSGISCADFGAAKGHPGYVSHWDYPGYGEGGRGMSSPPLVVGDLLIVGSGSNDGLTNAVDGVVRAFDVVSGELRWTFNPIPEDKRELTGAANVWSTMSADPELGLVFLPTTSPSTDYYGGGRLFEIPLSDAVVAVSTLDGEVAWSFQTVHHDLFDYDLPGHALLVTIQKDGKARDVAIQQTKMGHLFVFDRATGEPVFPIEERPVPGSDIADENAAPTQPFPVLPEPFARQTMRREDLFGATLFDYWWCRARFDELRYEGMFTPPGEGEALLFPSALGGGNWGGAAYDPNSNSLIIKAENLATRLKFVAKSPDEEIKARDYLTRPLQGTPYRTVGEIFMSPMGIPCTPPPWGTLTSIDMDSGMIRWQIPLGQVKHFGITLPAQLGWGSPHVGGPIITGGGLVFVAGTLDEKIRAYDTANGKELWQAKLPAPGVAIPMSYAVGQRQYVVIAAGGHARADTARSDAIVAFALP